ncbi:hypothetical protein I3760_02G097400 [Carya illinoinensis]|nr:hypothetical protein I3760_02G097400 [Carya illinoinensis]
MLLLSFHHRLSSPLIDTNRHNLLPSMSFCSLFITQSQLSSLFSIPSVLHEDLPNACRKSKKTTFDFNIDNENGSHCVWIVIKLTVWIC